MTNATTDRETDHAPWGRRLARVALVVYSVAYLTFAGIQLGKVFEDPWPEASRLGGLLIVTAVFAVSIHRLAVRAGVSITVSDSPPGR
ncbi:hypothetical protein NHL50_15030 [Acidimicrobiia bacterium EGI L10123]|uniref:hypothetical protein n=1 Tax=Salinilacustrithrix flava TaxID=2957203 RepID=UPI003D7C19EA|nr:hypothetical protein [Acidimicrobiia bacterium EGI L10123]